MTKAAIKKDSPGILIPPPLVYVVIYLLSMLIQNMVPLDRSFFFSTIAANLAIVFILLSVVFCITAFIQFIRSKNAIVPIRSASSLQTTGIYSLTRNPMYFGLLMLYLGLAISKGNWWTLMLTPLLILIVQVFIIKREEAYLERAFGQDYCDYKKRVRRWI
jgi:protein-S-isoprenylcysteine O-methyltransferase Ste14